MGARARVRSTGLKGLLWPSVVLASALLLAFFSSIAKRDGHFHASAFLALVSLILAVISSLALVPRLVVRVQLDYLYRLQSFRFTKRGAGFILILLLLALSALNTGNNLLILILSFLLASLIVSGIVSNLVLHDLRVSLTSPAAIHAGQTAFFLMKLRNLKRFFPSFALKLKGEEKPLDHESPGADLVRLEARFPYIPAGTELSSSLRCEFRRRGVHFIEGFEVGTTFPFGFFARTTQLRTDGSLVVYPELRDLNPLFAGHPFLIPTEERLQKGSGSGLYNIRPYRSGDSTRFVHWKSTAKLAQFMIKDFCAEEESPLHLVFSTFLPHLSATACRQFEKGVSYVASLSHRYYSRGQAFCFQSGEFEVSVGTRRQEYESLMEYLARVAPSATPLVKERIPENAVLFAAGRSVSGQGIAVIDYLAL
ncbi:MAG: DUF58 domain-containing protein [Acidobacteriota bacterium]